MPIGRFTLLIVHERSRSRRYGLPLNIQGLQLVCEGTSQKMNGVFRLKAVRKSLC